MTRQILDEIIDAIIQNDGRHATRPRTRPAYSHLPKAKSTFRADWMQELPGDGEEKGHASPWPRHPGYALTRNAR